MYYSIHHVTTFQYSEPISESAMELRMKPRTEGNQVCRSFDVSLSPRANLLVYRDHLGNSIHHFNLLRHHSQLTITATAGVEVNPPTPLPQSLDTGVWTEIDRLAAGKDFWDLLNPSRFARPSPLLAGLAKELGMERRSDPLSLLREMTSAIYHTFSYVQRSTRVDSPIDEAIEARQGVCQDFTHIQIALIRELGIPCRYVSGYLFHREEEDRSDEDATHAWAEALLPGLGWIGLDPTNDLITTDRHIRVAVGRDYADVPPTRGVFHGGAKSELAVAVRVESVDVLPEGPAPSDYLSAEDELIEEILPGHWVTSTLPAYDARLENQPQQQQQASQFRANVAG